MTAPEISNSASEPASKLKYGEIAIAANILTTFPTPGLVESMTFTLVCLNSPPNAH